MTLQEIIDFAKFGNNVNASQIPDDVSSSWWVTMGNIAYKQIWSRFRTQVSRASLLSRVDLAWTYGQSTFTLPTQLQNSLIYQAYTLSPTGDLLAPFDARFLTRNVLTSLQVGATNNLTQTFPFALFYIPDVERLELTSTPTLIPPVHHEVIAWELMRVIKMLTDKEVPQSWVDHIESVEFQLISEWKTRPMAARPNIVSLDQPMYRPLID